MTTPFNTSINPVTDGEAVSSAVVMRPINQVFSNTISLSEKVDNALAGTALIDWASPCQADAIAGMAVYLANDGIYKPGLAISQMTADGATLELGPSSFVTGIVQTKNTSENADIVLVGKMGLTAAQLLAITVDGTVHTGQLYLAAQQGREGKLTSLEPPIGVPVCYVSGPDAAGNYSMTVLPIANDPFQDHLHYKMRLPFTIIGDIGNANIDAGSTLGGWIPANDSGYGDAYWAYKGVTVSTNVDFGYLVQVDSESKNVWPPIPVGAVYYEIDGVGQDLNGGDPDFVIDREGIWMHNDGAGSFANPEAAGTVHNLYFLRMSFRNNDSAVTKLASTDNSIVLTDAVTGLTVPSGTGSLQIAARFSGLVSQNSALDVALKAVDQTLGTFEYGEIVTYIKSTNQNTCTLSGTTYVGEDDAYHGNVLITVPLQDTDSAGAVEFVSLDNAPLTETSGIFYYELKNDLDSYIRGKVVIPPSLPPDTYDLTLTFVIYATITGTIPAMDISHRVISPNTTPGNTTGVPSLTTDTEVADSIPAQAVQAGEIYKKAANFTITCAPGDIVYFTVSRLGSTTGPEGYAGSAGLMEQIWSVVPTP